MDLHLPRTETSLLLNELRFPEQTPVSLRLTSELHNETRPLSWIIWVSLCNGGYANSLERFSRQHGRIPWFLI